MKSYKQKYKILIALLVVSSIVVYKLTFSKTLYAYFSSQDLKKKAMSIQNAPEKIAGLQKQIASFDAIIGGNSNDTVEIRNHILKLSGTYCASHHLTIIGFQPPVENVRTGFVVETNILTIEGSFVDIVGFVNQLESKWKVGKVISTRFFSYMDLKSREKSLRAQIYIQKVKPVNS